MKLLTLTLPTAAENVALDEALLDEADSCEAPEEVVRLWESTSAAVVIGRSSKAAEEVDLDFCREKRIPVLRRCSGGAAVVLGPGCLMYSLILSYRLRPELRLIDEVHRFVLGRLASSLRGLPLEVEHQGISDLAWGGRKVSGNSLRCKRHALLYHGTLLYNFPLLLVANCLRTAPRQPEYRAGREHLDFVVNLPLCAEKIRDSVLGTWPITGTLPNWPRERTEQLVAERYSRDEWNLRL
jgi:lipoate---protein ligase